METVQQHEWKKLRGAKDWIKCKHCVVLYDQVQEVYLEKDGNYTAKEPPCITRPKQPDIEKKTG
jgi:hypothetical protein